MANGAFEAGMGQVNSQELPNHEVSKRRLDSFSVLNEGGDSQFNAAPEASDLHSLIARNEAAIYEQMARITERFNSLPAEHKQTLVSSFASHHTGADYPLYDAIRKTVTV